jgi:FOG: GGDEF domain
MERFGGDEFIVLGHEGGSFAEEFEKKLTRNLNELNETADKPYKVSVSIGHITAVPKKGDSLFDLIQQADADMYRVKHTKK